MVSTAAAAGSSAALGDVAEYAATGATWCGATRAHMALLATANTHTSHSSVLHHDAVPLHVDEARQGLRHGDADDAGASSDVGPIPVANMFNMADVAILPNNAK